MSSEPADIPTLARLGALIEQWLVQQVATNPVAAGTEVVEAGRVWYLRLLGEQKEAFGVLFTLGQRTLSYETYFMPAPPPSTAAAVYQHLLRRNATLRGCHLAIGEEDAVYLIGRIDLAGLTGTAQDLSAQGDTAQGGAASADAVLDRVLGVLYEATERCFRPAMRLAFPGFDAGPPRMP